jgi:hypothetical protein
LNEKQSSRLGTTWSRSPTGELFAAFEPSSQPAHGHKLTRHDGTRVTVFALAIAYLEEIEEDAEGGVTC